MPQARSRVTGGTLNKFPALRASAFHSGSLLTSDLEGLSTDQNPRTLRGPSTGRVARGLRRGILARDSHSTAKDARPNGILVMTDDQSYSDVSCHGNAIFKTPYLDKLHAESVHFTDFHVSPICTPTRAAFITGNHAAARNLLLAKRARKPETGGTHGEKGS